MGKIKCSFQRARYLKLRLWKVTELLVMNSRVNMKVVIEEKWRKRLLEIKVVSFYFSSVILRAVLRLAERRKHQEQEKSLESFGCPTNCVRT